MNSITPQEAKQITEEAYIFAYSMRENYKIMYVQAVNQNLPTYRAPFNQFGHMRQLLTPEFTEVVGPNNDTLYSLAWLDLGTEPVVLGLPDFPDERYYVIQIVDMYTFNVEYIGARTTGYEAAKYLFAGPGPDERPLMKKWARIGVQPGGAFDPDSLAPEVREAVPCVSTGPSRMFSTASGSRRQ